MRYKTSELVRYAPELPAELPPSKRKREVPLHHIVDPLVQKRYREDEAFRARVASISPEDSPNGNTDFDDRDLAATIKEDGVKNNVQRVIREKLGTLSTAIKRCLSMHSVSRRQRIAQSRDNLLGSSQPAE
jgi:hypothetical protein